MPKFVTVATTDELGLGGAKQVHVDGKTLALFNLAGTYYAIDDTCPHRGGSLSQGAIEGDQVTCPRHGAVFRITSGEVLRPPAQTAVAGYTVRVAAVEVVQRAEPIEDPAKDLKTLVVDEATTEVRIR